MVFNPRSLRNKTFGVCEFLTKNNCDVCCITEAWLKMKDKAILAEINDMGFEVKFQPRRGSKRGGGVCVLYKPDLTVEKCTVKSSYRSYEVLQTTVKSSYNLYRISTFYRTGTLSADSRNDFITDLNDYLDSLVPLKGENILCGDFNIHVNDEVIADTTSLYSLTESYGYEQLIQGSTHRDGNTLDLLFVQSAGSCKQLASQSLHIYELCYSLTSDHKFIECLIPFIRDPAKTMKEIKSYRDFKSINLDQFCSDAKMRLKSLCDDFASLINVNDAVHCLNDALQYATNIHAPLVTKCFIKKRTSYTNPEILSLRRQRRMYERRFRRHKAHADLEMFHKLQKDVEKSVRASRNLFYKNGLSKNKGDKRETFKLLNDMLGERKSNPLPDFTCEKELCDDFEKYFVSKVDKVRNSIKHITLSEHIPTYGAPQNTISDFCSFSPVNENNYRDILRSLTNKHCELDIIPTPLFKNCSEELSEYVLHVINTSLQSGVFPDHFKEALVKPKLKKTSLDRNDNKNFRPVTNLCFLSKVIEKCVLKQLLSYLENNDLFSNVQSAYRQFHSCETAIAKVSNDIFMNLDNNDPTFLVFLDLSSAFDLVDHSILLKRLKERFGLTGTVYNWFASYLTGRSFRVKIGCSFSNGTLIFYGVPQGSILGPILFLLYVSEIEHIAKLYGFKIHMFADDMQLYISFHPCGVLESLHNIEHCLRHINMWMSNNFLKINEDKTQFMIIAPPKLNRERFSNICISFGGSLLFPTTEGANLGVTFDDTMSFSNHINTITSKGYFYMNNFYRVADKLNYDLKVQMVMTYILPLIDYCNIILISATQSNRYKLQKLLNCAIRFIFNLHGKKRRLSITPFMEKLHVLPIDYRIQYKLCLLVYKCIYGAAPQYLCDMFSAKVTDSRLRSSSDLLMLEATVSKTTYGDYAFANAASKSWNILPMNVKQSPSIEVFKSSLKTFLYRKCYCTD